MKVLAVLRKLPLSIMAALALAAAIASPVAAHVTVKPGEAPTAAYQVFTVSVPNEKDIPTVSVKLLLPETLTNVTPTKKAGWEVTVEGSQAATISLAWSGNEITDGLRDEFTFSAKTPDSPTELQWKAYQTYADGTVVAWDQAVSEDGHDSASGPFSVTNVVTELANSPAQSTEQAIADAIASADRALYVGIVALLVGLAATFLATRKQ